MLRQMKLVAGTHNGPPAIKPLILPDTLFDQQIAMSVGDRRVELLQFDIHSDDGTLLLLPDEGVLSAGDTLEDPVTFVTEPDRLSIPLAELHRPRSPSTTDGQIGMGVSLGLNLNPRAFEPEKGRRHVGR